MLIAGALAVIPSAEALEDAKSGASAADPAKAAAMAATGTALRRFEGLMRPIEERLQGLVQVHVHVRVVTVVSSDRETFQVYFIKIFDI